MAYVDGFKNVVSAVFIVCKQYFDNRSQCKIRCQEGERWGYGGWWVRTRSWKCPQKLINDEINEI